MSNQSNHIKESGIDFISGIVGGVCSVFVGQPFDTIKVKLQISSNNVYKNAFDCFVKTVKHEGIIKGLYAGTGPALIANVGEYSTLLLAYGICQNFLVNITNSDSTKDLNLIGNATCGSLASFFSSVILTPTELIKCKLQSSPELKQQAEIKGKRFRQQGAIAITKDIIKNEGLRGMFRGLGATLGREMPGFFFFFAGYEETRFLLTKPGQSKEDIGLLRTMISGGVGGIVFWIAVYPIDFAKSRIQVYKEKGGIVGIVSRELRKSGFVNVYKGLPPTLLRTVPTTMVVFSVYEYTRKLLNSL